MIARDNAAYRLELAKQHFVMAKEDLDLRRWPSTIGNAQLAVENAAKAILACFGPVPRNHDTAERLQVILGLGLSQELAGDIEAALPIFAEYGREKHILATYGDEKALRTPWTLFGEEDARKALGDAHRCLGVAEAVYKYFFD